MRTIYKYPLHIGSQKLDLPVGARILDVQEQRHVLTLWAIVDSSPEAPRKAFFLHVVMTGTDLPNAMDDLEHVATVQQGEFVWHVFLEPK